MGLVVLVVALAVPAVASASFIVDSTADEPDVAFDESCLTAAGKCTLRAAIEEANAEAGSTEIEFDETVFDGQVSGTITLSDSLPTIEGPLVINGECTTAAGVIGPCVGVDGPSGKTALSVDETKEAPVEEAEKVAIEGLAFTGAETGISVDNSKYFRAIDSWFGVGLDGNLDGMTTGVFLGSGSSESRIGNGGLGTGNVFAGSAEDGLDIVGASSVEVLGNYFGVKPDGATPAVNGKDIEVSSTDDIGASGISIGTRVSPKAAATPECDGGCNVISGALSTGIDLEGDSKPEEPPAVATTIRGNYIGLNAAGTAPVANASVDVYVGKAAQTVVGGSKPGEANRINGGEVGVEAGPAAPDLVVRGNLIGVDASGTGSLAPPGEGILVESEKLPSSAVEAVIADNELRMDGGVAIAQGGYGATIAENRISGAKVGIETFGFTAEHGNLIEGNSIAGPGDNGILVENDLNEIIGNAIADAGDAGIWIKGSPTSFVTGNLIGGDTAAGENVINGSGGDAIEILDRQHTANEVARNRGGANNGLFIDLIPAKPGTEKDPNNGIEPPELSTLSQASAGGSAKAGATVRVFGKQSAAAGEVESFLGEATADADGNWEVFFGGAIPAGTFVAATQTSEGGTSELAPATTIPGAGDTPVGGGGGGGGDVVGGILGDIGKSLARRSRSRPQTKIMKGPGKRSRNGSARFEFKSNERGSVFLCKLDGKPFDLCKSPKRYQHLEPGKHVFKVRAVNPEGRIDSSPAKSQFTVLN